jgi:hypothetical protein
MQIERKKTVEFEESLVVFGNTDEQLFGAISEIDPNDRSDTEFRCQPDEIHATRGVIDVSQCKFGHTSVLCFFEENFWWHDAIAKAEI